MFNCFAYPSQNKTQITFGDVRVLAVLPKLRVTDKNVSYGLPALVLAWQHGNDAHWNDARDQSFNPGGQVVDDGRFFGLQFALRSRYYETSTCRLIQRYLELGAKRLVAEPTKHLCRRMTKHLLASVPKR